MNELKVGDTIQCHNDYDRRKVQKDLKKHGVITKCDEDMKYRIIVIRTEEE